MTQATNIPHPPLLISSVFAPLLAGQPGTDAEFTFRMEEAANAAYGPTVPSVRVAFNRLQKTFLDLVETVAGNHFLQIAVERQSSEGIAIEATFEELSELISAELAQAKVDIQTWGDDTKRRSHQMQPTILAATDLLVTLTKNIDALSTTVANADALRYSSRERYLAAGLTRQEMEKVVIEPTFHQVEEIKFAIKGLETKRRLVSSFLGDYPRWRLEKLQGIELPTLALHQERQLNSDRRAQA